MTTARTIARSFAGGELSPELVGRMDLDKYQTGLALCKNFITLPHGPAQTRPGFAYVNQCKDSSKKVRLIPFSFSAEETMVLEFGHLYIRFHTNGGTLLEPLKVIGDVVGNLIEVTAHGYSAGNWVYITDRFYRIATVPDVNHFTVTDVNGAAAAPNPVTAGGASRVHEVVTPYTESVLFDIHYVQSADVLTLVHPSFPIKELRRFAAVLWALADVSFAPILAAPTGVSVTELQDAATTALRDYSYVVTAVNATGIEESEASASVTNNNNLGQFANYNDVSWSAVTGAARYNVYRKQSGVFGYIGQTTDLTFRDNNISPDTLRTPPELSDPFAGANNRPSAVTYFDQRRVFSATNNEPQNTWMTKAGSETNMGTSLPVQDDDSISFKIAARQQNRIRHLVPLSDLIMLTAGGEWRVFTGSGEPVTPASLIARPQSYVGSNNVQPVLTSLSAIYVSAQGSKFRELIYSAEGVGTYKSEDLSVLIPHLTNGYLITDLAFSRGPTPLVWAVRSDGTLLGLTYMPEQVVRAWHQHDTTNGVFESVCCVAEGNDDVLYVVVRRVVDGRTVRYVERLSSQLFASQVEAFVVDSGLSLDVRNKNAALTMTLSGGTTWLSSELVTMTASAAAFSGASVGRYYTLRYEGHNIPVIVTAYTSTTVVTVRLLAMCPEALRGQATAEWETPVSTISGLWHLEGQTVNILGDGAVFPPAVVTNGAVELDERVACVSIGLPIVSELETLPLAIEGLATGGPSFVKNVTRAFLRVYQSSGVFLGPDAEHLTEYKQRSSEIYGDAPALVNGEIEISITPTWSKDGKIYIRQTAPLPLTIQSIALEVAVGR